VTATAPVDPGVDLSSFVPLPVNADEGFPQSFLFALGSDTYRAEFYVNVAETNLPGRPVDPRTTVDVVGDRAAIASKGMLIGAITRQDRTGDVPLLRRRLEPGLLYTLPDLLILLDDAQIAIGNLNGVGSYGSVLTARVARR
jgi:hypothetical protein